MRSKLAQWSVPVIPAFERLEARVLCISGYYQRSEPFFREAYA